MRPCSEAHGDVPGLAVCIVADHFASTRSILGIGHGLHKRLTRARLCFKNSHSGNHVRQMNLIASDLGMDWRLCRGNAVVGRAVGLVRHIAEETLNSSSPEIWERIEGETSDRAGQA